MIREYLEKYQNELLQKKILLDKECHELRTKLKENFQFILLLEEEENIDYESFIPREGNQKNLIKIAKLKKEQMQIQKEMEEKAYELSDIETRLAELTSVMKVCREKENALKTEIKKEDALGLRFLETQELERQRIARDLHDSTVQNITGMIYKTEFCSKLVDINPEKCKEELKNVSKTLHDVVDEMRNLIYDLHPVSHDDIGLDMTIKKELSRLEKEAHVKVDYHIDKDFGNIKKVISSTIFRIVQETCNNIIKYADAEKVNVSLTRSEDKIKLVVQDNGRGFDVDKFGESVRKDYSGFGISIMKERVYLLSGEFYIESKLGKGTKVTVIVPLT